MQLTTLPASTAVSPFRAALAAAAAGLLAPGVASAQTPQGAAAGASATPPAWQVDSALLLYSESGSRVRAVEPVVSLRRTDSRERTIGIKLTLDALTGASPNGAVPQPSVQTFTSPSGNKTYDVAANRLPLDPSFRDGRGALALSWEQPWGNDQRLALGASVSKEYDFASLSASASLARDFDRRNTTVSVGLAVEADLIDPVGGTPTGLTPAFGANASRRPDESRQVLDLLLGVTQVMNRQWLTQLILGLGRGSGNHTDPYKLLSVVDGTSGLLAGDAYVAELRPDSRNRLSLYWQNKVHLARDVVDLSYRFYRDDWGIRSHTLDARYRWELPGGRYLEPRWRHYRQSAADFWRGWLVEGADWSSATHAATLAHASADPRLAALHANTLGVKFGFPLGPRGEASLRLESYRQQQQKPGNAPGALQTQNLAPGLRATSLMLGYSTSF
jgi:hypothetical protein